MVAAHKSVVVGAVVGAFVFAVFGMGFVNQQFFPSSERPEVTVDVRLPEGASIETTSAAAAKVEAWLRQQPEAKIVTAYIGQGSPRFFISYNPELSDPSFAKIIVLTPDATARERLMAHLRVRVAQGLAPEALVRATAVRVRPFRAIPGRLSRSGS